MLSYILSLDKMMKNAHRMDALNDAAQLHALLESATLTDLNVGGGITEGYAEELVTWIRVGRG
jgi:hypothetical protein